MFMSKYREDMAYKNTRKKKGCKNMKQKRFNFRLLSFTILSDDPKQEITRFTIPNFFVPLLAIMIILTVSLTTYLSFHYYKKSKQLAIDKEQLTTDLQEKEEISEQLFVEVGNLKEKEKEIQHQLDVLYELESQVKETVKDLPVSIEPSGGIDISISEQEAKLLEEQTFTVTAKISDLISRYKNTLKVVEKTNEELRFIPTEWPVTKNKITSKFGLRTDPFKRTSSFHTGVDIRGKVGDPVFAAAEGTVIQAEYFGGYGNYIVIQHSDVYTTSYAHLSKIDVEVGDKINKGEIIGAVGSTGRSTGPHLHYEIIKNGKPIDPYTYLSISDKVDEGES